MHKILVLNSGSSTVKFQLFLAENGCFNVLARGLAERIGLKGSRLKLEIPERQTMEEELDLPDHEAAIKEVLALLLKTVLNGMDELSAVGHRMGHGGEYFDKSVIIDKNVMDKIYDTLDLLPLHGAAFVHGVEAVTHLLPNVPQVATFDSAFHQTMPKKAFLYALPLEQYEKYRIRRYGFHGTSHCFVSEEAAKMLGYKGRFITCHLGNGASLAAIKDGKSIDTTMGFTPMVGTIMGTRCGDIDAYIPFHIMKTQNKTLNEVNAMLNKESGLFGLSRGHSDIRDIEAECLKGNQDAVTAVEIYVYNLVKQIGAYVAALGGVDALIFTAGIGEKSSFIRKKVCENLTYLGLELDEQANHLRGGAREINTPSSKVKVLVIPTNEELVIARDTCELLFGSQKISAVA